MQIFWTCGQISRNLFDSWPEPWIVKHEQHIMKKIKKTKSGRGTIEKRKEAVEWTEAAVALQCGRQPKKHSWAGGRHTETCSFYDKAHTGAHPHSANTRQQMTPRPFVATGGLLFQLSHRHAPWQTAAWRLEMPFLVGFAALLFVTSAFLINSHSLYCRLAGLHFAIRNNRAASSTWQPTTQHLPFIYCPGPLGRLCFWRGIVGGGWCWGRWKNKVRWEMVAPGEHRRAAAEVKYLLDGLKQSAPALHLV